MSGMLTLTLIGFLGGLIIGISPCILPVLPVIFFSGASTSRRPYLVIAGLALSFSVVTLVGSTLLALLTSAAGRDPMGGTGVSRDHRDRADLPARRAATGGSVRPDTSASDRHRRQRLRARPCTGCAVRTLRRAGAGRDRRRRRHGVDRVADDHADGRVRARRGSAAAGLRARGAANHRARQRVSTAAAHDPRSPAASR